MNIIAKQINTICRTLFLLYSCPCLSLYPDSEHSSWNVEVELFFDVFVASKGLVHLSIPLLQSEAEFQLSLTPGQIKKSFVLQLNQVRSGLVCFFMTTLCHFNIFQRKYHMYHCYFSIIEIVL